MTHWFSRSCYALATAATFVLCTAATCEDIPPDVECVFDGTYVNWTAPRPGNPAECGELTLPPGDAENETRPCQFDYPEDGTSAVCFPGNPVDYCYGRVTFGECSWDVLTVRE